ncbi:medium-chain acyl-[acyl-carrier-protein] hydrolase [Catenulispora sp. EB89]|uniref:thioesterase II family protein n=1 Tax=Catenulispora sp. EB89 TaxID=3156257 RepID=UPI00351863CC
MTDHRTAASWTHLLAGGPDSSKTLVCLHHAGGTAAAFRSWARYLAPDTEMLAVQLPGRSERFQEPALDRMQPVVDGVMEHVVPLLDRPFALFGMSMGARVGLAVAQALHQAGLHRPEMLIVGASPAPVLRTAVPGWNQNDAELTAYLVGTGGVPPEVAAAPEVMELMLPTVRADLTAVATWPHQGDRLLDRPIAALAGRQDPYAAPSLMQGWATETSADFSLTEFDGGHFFVEPNLPAVVSTINTLLSAVDRHQEGSIP